MSDNAIELHAVDKQYGETYALRDVELTVQTGEIRGLIGPNGAGKTTLSAGIAGEVPFTRGRVRLLGHDTTRWNARRVARLGVGRSFQVAQVFDELSVEQNVALAAEVAGLSPLRAVLSRRWSPDLSHLERVGLLGRREVPAGELAQADRKLLELAMVLVGEPRVVVLDEPTAGMSSQEAEECAELLRELAAEQELTLLITEHNMNVMFRLAHSITVLVGGEVLLTGAPEQVRTDRRLAEVYFGSDAEEEEATR